MTKHERELFIKGFRYGARKIHRHPLWLASLIFLQTICTLREPAMAIVFLFTLAIWVWGYVRNLVDYPDEV